MLDSKRKANIHSPWPFAILFSRAPPATSGASTSLHLPAPCCHPSASPAGSDDDDNDNTPRANGNANVNATDSETEPDSQASQADAEEVAHANRSIFSDDLTQEILAPDTPRSEIQNQLGDPRYSWWRDCDKGGKYQKLHEGWGLLTIA
jgi:hypothetical protein